MCFNDDFVQHLEQYQKSPLLTSKDFDTDENTEVELEDDVLELAILSAERTRKEFFKE